MENWQPTGEQDSKAQHSTPQVQTQPAFN